MNPSHLIESLGGTCAVAKFFGIKPPSVSGWKSDGIPKDRLICLAPILEDKGIASRKVLLPDDWHLIWPELAESDAGVKLQAAESAFELGTGDH